jgi:hypothetical protein
LACELSYIFKYCCNKQYDAKEAVADLVYEITNAPLVKVNKQQIKDFIEDKEVSCIQFEFKDKE